jgi:beta-1,4-mannosyltransferase
MYEHKAREQGKGRLPKILMIVTGKGPLRDKYMKKIDLLQGGDNKWEWVKCISLWLEPEDYPLLLGLTL